MRLPDLSGYRLHRVVDDADLDGVAVPGLRAQFYRRDDGGRLASAGQYRYGDRELLLAWGYVGEPHCRYSAVRNPDGRWSPPMPGCQQVRFARTRERVTGLAVRDAHGRWIWAPDPSGPPGGRYGPDGSGAGGTAG